MSENDNINIQLEYPRRILISGILCTSFFLIVTVVSNLFPNQTTTWETTTGFLFFSSLGVYIIIDFMRSKFSVTSSAIKYRNSFFKTTEVSWNDIEEVDFSRINSCFILKTRDKKRIRFSLLLQGIGEFKILLNEKIIESKISNGAKQALIYIYKKS